MNMKLLALASTSLLALSSFANAALVPIGNTVSLGGTTSASNPALAGLVVADTVEPFTINGNTVTGAPVNITGTVQSRVVKSDVDNSYDFYWRIVVNAANGFAIDSLRLNRFGLASDLFDANYRTDGLGSNAPNSIRRFTGSDATSYNFLFDTAPIGAGQSSYFLLMDTNASNYAKTATYDMTLSGVSGGPISATFSTFSPAPVPVPAGLPLLLSGIAALGWFGGAGRKSASNKG